MKTLSHYTDIIAYTTKDGSTIRELMHPDQHAVKNQSVAEASVPLSSETQLHKHLLSEEIYHITQGHGLMRLGNKTFSVASGDTICIPPNTEHNIKNTGSDTLKILCCCSPAYSHHDTLLI